MAAFRHAQRNNTEYNIRRDLEDILQGDDNNPLDIERQLIILRWRYLEEQDAGHHFDINFLVIYFLKLQLLQRLFIFDKEKGRERFLAFSKVE